MPEQRAKPEHQKRVAALVAVCGMLILPCAVHAAEAVVDASLEVVQEKLYGALDARQIVVADDAQTDRFALVYAQTPEGGHVSISIRQLASPDRTRVNVTSDSPANPALDQALLEDLQTPP